MKDVTGYLKTQQSISSTPEMASEWHTLEEFYNKKLWHQLTLKLTDFVKDPCFATGDGLIQLYDNFLSDFDHRINPLSLVEIILYVARQMTDPKDAITFLEKTKEKVKSNDESVILCKTSIGALKLEINDLPATKILIEEVEETLNNLPGVTSVHGRFYDLSSKYYRIVGNHASYYKDALRYLGCVDIKDLPETEKQERAFTLGLAGLLGEGVYNFGELLMHPVLESLRSTDKQWLIDTLYSFNGGNVEKFQAYKSAWGAQLIVNGLNLGLIVILGCPLQVELLVMKALSVGLIKGNIDEVDQKIQMTWVQPRVLDLQQIKGMKDRLDLWCGDVKNMAVLVEQQAHDILT
uniref:PSD13 N-terminal domain-containing protein n=1 Tax=Oncorhynchus mykiss TaxID=8022 RepID=A0A8C7SG29_ONCMY